MHGDVAQEVARLKAEPGRDVGIHGSAGLMRHRLGHGLVDELELAVFPAVVGKGDPQFDGLDPTRHLHPTHLDQTGKGVLVLTYRPLAA